MEFAKTDLHVHLDGALPVETILRLAAQQGISLPADTPEGLLPHCTVPSDCSSLADYLQCFALPLRVLQTADALYEATTDLLRTLAQQGLTYAEIRFAPQQHGLSQAAAVEAVLRATQQSAPLQASVILCMLTTGDMVANAQTAELAVAYRHAGVCGLDLAGQEGARPLSDFARFFAQAVENSVGVTIHAGEACGAESVAAALACGAQRIGHGTRVIEDAQVLRQVIDAGITLEQCVTSNVQTRCADSARTHPIRRLFDAGVKIALCTDNCTVSGVTLAGEYALLQQACGFTPAECARLAEYAAEARFGSAG